MFSEDVKKWSSQKYGRKIQIFTKYKYTTIKKQQIYFFFK